MKMLVNSLIGASNCKENAFKQETKCLSSHRNSPTSQLKKKKKATAALLACHIETLQW
jgi:hypothetical protein